MLLFGIMSPKSDAVVDASRIRPTRDASATGSQAHTNDETIAFDSR